MRLTTATKNWLAKNTSFAATDSEEDAKQHLSEAIKRGNLTVEKFNELQADNGGPSPDDLFGHGDKGGSRGTMTKALGKHVKTGLPMKNERGHDCLLPSQHENAKAGAFLKHLASRGGLGISLTKSERELLDECWNDAWCGKFQSHYMAGIPGANIKAVLNDAISGGAEVNPEWFDNNLITFPLLNGELFPFVDLRPVPRASSVEGASVGNPTAIWGQPEGTEMALFNTSDIIAEINTSIFNVSVCLEVGKDFLLDAAADVGRVLVENVGQRMSSELDRVTGIGNGTSEPQGIFNASGLTTVTTENGASGPPTLADYESLLFALPKQYRNKGERPMFVSNDVTYRRSRGMKVDPHAASVNESRLLGMNYENYESMGYPHKIQNDIENTKAAIVAMARYRMYRRQGFEVRWEQGGKELALKNMVLLIVRGRFGGKLVDANAAAKWTNGQS
jgi:HK97 family phage major capsid protein